MHDMVPQPGYLDIEVQRSRGVLRVQLKGELDMLTAPLLSEALARIRTSDPPHLVVDMTELHFMDRAGLAALLELAGDGAGRSVLTVTGCRENVRRVLELTGYDELIDDTPAMDLAASGGGATPRDARKPKARRG
jgi:anti-sigma B factor antagonist